MLALYFFRLVLMLPVLAALAVSTAIASAAGLLLRALRWIFLVPPLVACIVLLTPDESDAQGEGGRDTAAGQHIDNRPAQVRPTFDTAAR